MVVWGAGQLAKPGNPGLTMAPLPTLSGIVEIILPKAQKRGFYDYITEKLFICFS